MLLSWQRDANWKHGFLFSILFFFSLYLYQFIVFFPGSGFFLPIYIRQYKAIRRSRITTATWSIDLLLEIPLTAGSPRGRISCINLWGVRGLIFFFFAFCSLPHLHGCQERFDALYATSGGWYPWWWLKRRWKPQRRQLKTPVVKKEEKLDSQHVFNQGRGAATVG